VLGSVGNTAQATAAISGDLRLRPAFERAQSCERLRVLETPS
jgi:hypothetical protein